MGSSKKNTKANNLTSLPGVGAASAKKLIDAKLDTISKVAAAGTTKLVKAGIQAALAKKIAAAAKKVDQASNATKKAATKAKSAAKKAPAKAKAAAGKAKSAAKKAPAKAKAAAGKAKSVAAKAATKAKDLASKPKAERTNMDVATKGGRIGPSKSTPISKMSWFKKAKK